MKQRIAGFALFSLAALLLLGGCNQTREESLKASDAASRPVPARRETASAGEAAKASGAAFRSDAAAPQPLSAPHRPVPAASLPRTMIEKAALPAPATPSAVYNPNMYMSSTYIGGSGERDRLEKLIREGVLVDGKRVRLEAFARDYAQTFPIPTRTALSVTADMERAKITVGGDRTFLQVGLQAIQGEAPRRPPLNVALVLDRSGSMSAENKLAFAKAAAAELVERLRPDDVFSLVAFDNAADLLVPARRVGADTAQIQRKIAALAPGGGTNIFDGLKRGYAEAGKSAGRGDGVSLVILLSDGQVTAGVRDPNQFHRLVEANGERDIQTTTVGLGVAFNEDLMLDIARAGKGNYHFIRDGADTRTVFRKELDELTHVVARAVRLRIRLAEGVGLVRVLGSRKLDAGETRQAKAEERRIDRKVYEELGIAANREREPDEPGIQLLIPNFYRGDSHVVMLEISVPPGRGRRPIADVFLKYKDLTARANRQTRTAAAVTYTPDRAEMIASTNRSVKKNLLGFQTGEALVEAADLIAGGRVAEAVKRIDERMVVLGVAARAWGDPDLDRDGKLLDRYKTVLAQLDKNPQMARSDFGEYLKKSLTYNGYQRTH